MKFSESRLAKTYSEDQIRQKVEEEYQIGYTACIVKRQKFRLQDALVNHVSDTAANPFTRIDVKTITKFLETQISLYFTDELEVGFRATTLGGQEKAGRLNRVAKFDHRLMGKKFLDYDCQMNRILRGVGIEVMLGWDYAKKIPIFETIDTRQWIPDPLGGFDPKSHRFHGFETTATKGMLTEEQGYDMDIINNSKYDEAPETRLTRMTSQINQGMLPSGFSTSPTNNLSNQNVDLYHHYTMIDGYKYHITLCNVRKEICRIEQIDPVYKDEKKNPEQVPFPVTLHYWFPIKGDPYGINLIDMIESQHRYINELTNLMFIREKDAALGPDLLINSKSVKNIADLQEPSETRRLIPANDVRDAVMEIPVSSAPESNGRFLDRLQQTAMESASISNTDMGVQAGGELTLGQSQQIQAASNLKSMFKNTLNQTGEEQFWKLWHRAYKKHLKSSEKKLVIVEEYLGSSVMEIKKSEYIFDEDPEVEITSRNAISSENDQRRVNLVPILLSQLQDPSTPPYTQKLIRRKIYELNDIDRDEATLLTGQDAYELDAISKRTLLDNDMIEGAKIDDIMEDHETYIAVFQQGVKTQANFFAIKARQRAIIARQKLQEQQAQLAQQQGQPPTPTQGGAGSSGGATQSPFNNPISNMAIGSAMNQAAVANNTPRNVVTRAEARP